jgi:hypothetical protein
MPTDVVLVDFENVQPTSLEALNTDHHRVIVFVGANQSKVPIEIVSATQRMGERAQYIQIGGTGPNALDFHIAFYIGEIAAQDPTATFRVISKDKGFDPLIKHLRARGISATRSASVAKAKPSRAHAARPHTEKKPSSQPNHAKPSQAPIATERADALLNSLRQPKSTKPRTSESLAHHIATHFKKQQLSAPEIREVVDALRAQGAIVISDGRVSYSL